ncbi:hypothetical protein ABPG74_018954, partial [Tetrahymena malaccensis]
CNSISQIGASYLGEALENISNLQVLKLDLRFNQIDGNSASIICESIGNNTNLQTLKLNLRNTKTRQKGAVNLVSTISKFKKLHYLELRIGNIGDFSNESRSEIKMKIRKMQRVVKERIFIF